MSGARRFVPVTVGIVVFLIAAGAAVLLFSGDDASYSPETREAFLTACSADGGDEVESVCICWYDSITQSIPYDRFDEADSALMAQIEADPDSPLEIPDDFEALLVDCRPDAA